MKKIYLTLLCISLLGACSKKDGNEILECYGTLINGTIDKGVFTKANERKQLRFVDKKLAGYDRCEFDDKVILCYSMNNDGDVVIRHQLSYEKETKSFFEMSSKRTRPSLANFDGLLIDRSIFIGACEKPLF